MKILISNDDGVYAKGIHVLANHLKKIAHISMVAPDRNRSGASNSLTLDSPVRVKKLNKDTLSVEGTPTDCVHLAITGLLDEQPDMIVSGINEGANLGDDVLYSGTVAAAIEGRFLGVSAIAISLAINRQHENHFYYATAAKVASKLVNHLVKYPLPGHTILNVNVPNVLWTHIQGFEITRLGTRHMAERTIRETDPRGHPIYWVGPAGPEQDAGPGTDFHAVNSKRVSITPLRIDWTDYPSFERLSQWVQGLEK